VILDIIFGSLAGLSLALVLWQWVAALLFPLHKRTADGSFTPDLTLLKPLKGCDEYSEACLRSWFTQKYAGRVQIIFGVAKAEDPVCAIVEKLMREFPQFDARLMVCENLTGANAKVSKLARMEAEAKHELVVVSDADVWVPEDFLANVVGPLKDGNIGLVNCFYRLANPATMAMRWEAVAINADFWSQVLQSRTLKPLDFALGAVMVTRRKNLAEIGGFKALENCLADDYQLGHRIAKQGHRIELSPVVVECRSSPMNWGEVWRHQLRWARTIRVCQPAPYFFSILSNATLWAVVWLAVCPTKPVLGYAVGIIILRMAAAGELQWRLTGTTDWRKHSWLVPVKDLLQAAIWVCAFTGSGVEWRGQKFRVRRDGTLEKV